MGESEQRNRKLTALREELQRSPANLDLANTYWRVLAGDRAKNEPDYRSGRDVIEVYCEAALLSKEGVEPFASAYLELFHISGEIPGWSPKAWELQPATDRSVNLSMLRLSVLR